MKSPTDKIDDIVKALNAYSKIEAPDIVKATIEGMDEASIGVLRGITGVFIHAVCGKPEMPAKWQKQIHDDLLTAFQCLADIAHAERQAKPDLLVSCEHMLSFFESQHPEAFEAGGGEFSTDNGQPFNLDLAGAKAAIKLAKA